MCQGQSLNSSAMDKGFRIFFVIIMTTIRSFTTNIFTAWEKYRIDVGDYCYCYIVVCLSRNKASTYVVEDT